MKTTIDLLKITFTEWNRRDAPRMGAALAFYSILSLAPLLILAVGICALVFGASNAQTQLLEQFRQLVGPDGARAIEAVLKSAQKTATGILANMVGFVTLLFGASGAFVELRAALNHLWGEEPFAPASGLWSWIQDRFLSFGLVLAVGFLLLVSLAVSAGLATAGEFLSSLGFLPPVLWEMINLVVSLGGVAILFALMFRFLPTLRLPWRDLCVGAALTAVLFIIGKTGIGIYLGKAGVGSVYGAAGSLVVLVVWIYYSAQIFFFGAVFTHVYAQRHGLQSKVVSVGRGAQDTAGVTVRMSPAATRQQDKAPSLFARVVAAALVVAVMMRTGTRNPRL